MREGQSREGQLAGGNSKLIFYVFSADTLALTIYGITVPNIKEPDVPWGCNSLILPLAFWLAGCLLGFSPVQMAASLNQRMTHGFLILLQVATLLVRAHFLGVQIITFHLCYVLHNYIIFKIMLDGKVIKIQHDQNQNKIWKKMTLPVSSR